MKGFGKIHSGAPTARATRFFRVALAVYEMSGENCVAAEREKDKQKKKSVAARSSERSDALPRVPFKGFRQNPFRCTRSK